MSDVIPIKREQLIKYKGQQAVIAYNTDTGKYQWVAVVDLRHVRQGKAATHADAELAIKAVIDAVITEAEGATDVRTTLTTG